MKDIFYLIAFTAVMAVVYFAFIKLEKRINSYESVIAEKNSQIEYFMNENGKLVAGKQAAEVAVRDLKSMYPEIYRALSRDLDVKVKDLKAYMESGFLASGSGNGEIHNHYYTNENGDSVGVQKFVVNDSYLLLRATLIDSLNAPYTYTYSDTIKQSISIKRKWILGNEYLYGSATLSNPNAKITSSKNVLMQEYRDKRFSIGLGALYEPSSGKIRLGVGVNYALFKF